MNNQLLIYLVFWRLVLFIIICLPTIMRPQKPFKANTLKFHGISIHIRRKKKDKEEKKETNKIGKKWRTAPPKNCRPTVGQQSADSRPTVGRQLADSGLTVGRQLADCRPTVVRLSANCWPIVGQLSADCRLPLLRKSSASSRPTVGRLSADYWPHVGNLLAKCRLRTLVEYQKSLSSQERTLHIDAKWNFLT